MVASRGELNQKTMKYELAPHVITKDDALRLDQLAASLLNEKKTLVNHLIAQRSTLLSERKMVNGSQSSEMVVIMIIVLLPEVMIQQGDHEISENLKH